MPSYRKMRISLNRYLQLLYNYERLIILTCTSTFSLIWSLKGKKGNMAFLFFIPAIATHDIIAEEDQLKRVLQWYGFHTQVQRNTVYGDSIQLYSDLWNISEIHITDIAKVYLSHTVTSRINFGFHGIKKLNDMIHWVKIIAEYRQRLLSKE